MGSKRQSAPKMDAATARAADGARWERWAFGTLLGLQLVPLWAFTFVPTQDGPAHLENAAILLRRSTVAVIGQFYLPNPQLVPNWLGHGLLVPLLALFSPALAEKLALSGYVLALPLAFRHLLTPPARARGFALCIFPFLFGYTFYMGFTSFCWSLVFFFVALSIWFRSRGRLGPARLAGLGLASLAVALGHPVTLVALLITLGSLSSGRVLVDLARAQGSGRRARVLRYHGRLWASLAVALLPAAALVVAFSAGGAEGYGLQWLPLGRRLSGLAVLLSLVAVTPADLWVSAALAASIVVAVGTTAWARRHSVSASWEWLFAAGVTLLVALAAPDQFGRGWGMTLRLQFFPFALALLWVGLGRPLPGLARTLPAACSLASLALLGLRLPAHARLSHALEEYTSVAPHVPRGSVILPLQLTLGRDLDRDGLFPLNFSPLLHAAGYVAASRDSVDLANYEANTGLFPVRYRPERNPYLRLARGLGFEGEGSFPCVDLASGSDLGIDHVIVWGPLEDALVDPCVRDWARELARAYDLVFVSRPRHFAELWRRKPAAPPDAARSGVDR